MKRLLPALALLLLSAPALADGPIRSIVIFGNEKTEQKTILEIMNVPAQAYVNDALVREVDDRLAHSGLFKKVRIQKVRNPDGTNDLRITVVEKQLWFAFPVFQAWSGRYSGGAVFGESNLFVPGGGTLFLAQGGNKLSRVFAAFEHRNLFDSDFAVRTWFRWSQDDVPLYSGDVKTDEIRMKDVSLALVPGYRWTNDIQTGVKFFYAYVDYGELAAVPEAGQTGNDVSIEFRFTYDTLQRREAFLKGERLRASFELADSRFGSDFDYNTAVLTLEKAMPVLRYFNYVVEFQGAIGSGLPFHQEFTQGGASLRGFEERQFRGDTEIVLRQDLLGRIYRHPRFSIFGLAFYDLGMLYRDADGLGRSALNNGVGAGLRVSLADIVAPVFGVDGAYGIEDGAWRIYFAIGLVDF